MILDRYHKKRNFQQTPEPKGKAARHNGRLHFVVQKHDASHLHYDFRLEHDGVLKSWAVPKGVSLDPGDRRLAIEVEDHPWDYKDFEGVIPEGNYGAGTVIVWDEGEYYVDEDQSKEQNDRMIEAALKKGRLKFFLNGQKLKGRFSLVKTGKGRRSDKSQWLLIKGDDDYARQEIMDPERSVKSGRTLDELGGEASSTEPSQDLDEVIRSLGKLKAARKKAAIPDSCEPMLATLVDEPFDRKGWIFEVKWDGYRSLAVIENGKVSLRSRSWKEQNDHYPDLAQAWDGYPVDAVFDGEIVVVDETGVSRFQHLQNYRKTGQGTLLYYVFDILHLAGYDLRQLPLAKRREILWSALPSADRIRLSEEVKEAGIAFYNVVRENGLEGMIAKKANSVYQTGRRSRDWLKVKTVKVQEAVIVGYTAPHGSRKHLGALILGAYEKDGRLQYVGHSGGGFTDQSLQDIYEQLQPLVRETCPFEHTPPINAPATWVEPQLVCEVKFQEWTGGGAMRQPIFLGLREDKKAADVHRERPQDTSKIMKANAGSSSGKKRSSKKKGKSSDEISVRAPLTNLNKVFWPDEGYTKGDVIRYYQDIAPIILPYLKNRPQSLKRQPNGINGKHFFQKDVGEMPPEWIQTVAVESDSHEGDINYLLCQDADALAYINNLGCIELNVWNSSLPHLDHPDYLVFDLDPVEADFKKVVEVARETRRFLEELGVTGYCKTSGGRGLHIYVPLHHRYTSRQAKDFAHVLCVHLHDRLPSTTSLERSPKNRKGCVYLDYLQNNPSATMAAPYCLRPRPGASVSTPLEWSEVNARLDPARFTIKTMRRRLDKKGDLWKGVLGKGIDMKKVLRRLDEL